MRLQVNGDSNIEELLSRVYFFAENKLAQQTVNTEVITLSSELIYNIAKYGQFGVVEFIPDEGGVTIIASDNGGGFGNDFEKSFSDGYSTGGSLGLGLPSLIRLADEVELSTSNSGTYVKVRKEF